MKEGSCAATPFFTLFYKEHAGSADRSKATGSNDHDASRHDSSAADGVELNRVAYIAGKKNGNAVWRNKAKRKLRAAWQLKQSTPAGYDILLVAKKATTEVSATEIASALDELISCEGLLQ